MEDACTKIKEKLAELRALDGDQDLFGAAFHGYKLNEVCSENEIKAFEEKFGCVLPAGYKEFLTRVGNGGAGPGYGVFPLGLMDRNFGFAKWDDDFVSPDKRFKFTGPYNDTSILYRGAPEQATFSNPEEYEAEYEKWLEENSEDLELEYWIKHSMDGAIPICHHGCSNRSWLVVSEGAEYGTIWADDTADSGGVYPETLDGQPRIGFFEWYLDWLIKSIAEVREGGA